MEEKLIIYGNSFYKKGVREKPNVISEKLILFYHNKIIKNKQPIPIPYKYNGSA